MKVFELAVTQLKDATGRFKAWASEHPWPFFLLVAAVIVFAWILIQTIRFDNMGFAEKSFWDWMDLLLVPAVLAIVGLWFSHVQKQTELEIALEERDLDREIAWDRRMQSTLDSYLDKMTELILEEKLGPGAAPEVKRLARTRTITVLRSLDHIRNDQVIRFLRDSELLYLAESPSSVKPVVDLRGADLRRADLSRVYLRGVNLSGANLSYADLSWAGLKETDLSDALLSRADLRGASLSGANLSWALIGMADLDNANLDGANLEGAAVGKDRFLNVRTLEGAIMPDGTEYEEWVQRKKAEEEESGGDNS